MCLWKDIAEHGGQTRHVCMIWRAMEAWKLPPPQIFNTLSSPGVSSAQPSPLPYPPQPPWSTGTQPARWRIRVNLQPSAIEPLHQIMSPLPPSPHAFSKGTGATHTLSHCEALLLCATGGSTINMASSGGSRNTVTAYLIRSQF